MREATLGEHPHTAASLVNLARLYDAQRDYAGAERKLLRALDIFEASHHPETQKVRSRLVSLYVEQGDYFAAAELEFARGEYRSAAGLLLRSLAPALLRETF